VAVIDYEVTVAYTEGRRNLCQTLGKLLPGVENTLLGKTFGSGESFENWQSWVPSDASTYSLSMGANLHPLYEYVVHLIEHQIPEAQDALKQFDDLQKQYDVSLDRDILQAFSGESVSVTLPAAQPTLLGAQDSVLAMRCHKPERIRELLHRVVEHLQQLPFVAAQQLELEESTELDGFEELSANVFAMFGARPVIGFHNGWMIWASNAGAAKKVLETLAGNGQTILESDAYKAFELDVSGPVQSISYTDLAQRTRQAAMMLNQAGAIVPAVIGMAGAQADGDAEKLQTVQDLVALLPSVAKIVAKFDYLEANLSVTQKGERPDTYQRRGVTLVRAPE
jgi:hypothetical protein